MSPLTSSNPRRTTRLTIASIDPSSGISEIVTSCGRTS
jgi:hypothetical protein